MKVILGGMPAGEPGPCDRLTLVAVTEEERQALGAIARELGEGRRAAIRLNGRLQLVTTEASERGEGGEVS